MLNGTTYIVRPAHAAVEQLLELCLHLRGVHPVVGRAGVVLAVAADEGAVLDARDVAWDRSGQRKLFGRLSGLSRMKVPGAHHLLAERVVFRLGAVAPMDGLGLHNALTSSTQARSLGWRVMASAGRCVFNSPPRSSECYLVVICWMSISFRHNLIAGGACVTIDRQRPRPVSFRYIGSSGVRTRSANRKTRPPYLRGARTKEASPPPACPDRGWGRQTLAGPLS